MALDQTLALAKNIVLCTPRNLLIPSLTPNPSPPVCLFCSPANVKKNRRLSNYGGVRCWTDNDNHNNSNNARFNGSVGPQYPRPSVIPWSKEICNSVQLMGYVFVPVQSKLYDSDKLNAWTRLAVSKSPKDNCKFNLAFWDELAHVAVQHIQQGDQIYVSGRLLSETVDSEDGKRLTKFLVVVKELNFIIRKDSYDGGTGSATPGRKVSNDHVNNTVSVEELWQAFFVNPANWWDNRTKKRNVKSPDFKHKNTGEALWINRSTPPWVESQLEILDTRTGSIQNQNDGIQVNFDGGDDYTR